MYIKNRNNGRGENTSGGEHKRDISWISVEKPSKGYLKNNNMAIRNNGTFGSNGGGSGG
jgi:hypothetical protein